MREYPPPYFGWDSVHPDFVRGGSRVNRRSWLTDKGAHVVAAHASRGDHNDDRTITTDDDGSIYVTTSDGTTRAYHQYDDGGSFPRCLPGRGQRVVDDGPVRGRRAK